MEMSRRSESPEMDLARDRLGSLLESIRQNNLSERVTSNGKRSRDEEDEESDYEHSDDQSRSSPKSKPVAVSSGRRRSSTGQKAGKSSMKGEPGSASSFSSQQGSPSRKRKRPPQKKIIFELRQKAFEIQNSNLEQGLYALCRIWMRGKGSKDGGVSGHPIDRTTAEYSQELLLGPRSVSRKSTVRPEAKRDDPTIVTGNEESASDILQQYLPRWRQAKKDWCQQRSQDDVEKYGDSLRVLREMYATAQSHVITM